jgi:DeoR family transcriptional regulator, suf operon transcriptional repressor
VNWYTCRVEKTSPQSSTRRAILLAIKKGGEVRADDLAEALAITASAVRQHLGALVAEGLVAVREQRGGGAGRPKYFYATTAAAESLFPKTYGELTNELLDTLDAEEPEMVGRLFDRRRQRRVDDARARLEGKTFAARVRELARILDEDGYLATVEEGEGGTWRIVEHNCAILEVALRYGQACSSEIGFLREVMPDADIERLSHMVAGDFHCGYAVTPKAASESAPV